MTYEEAKTKFTFEKDKADFIYNNEGYVTFDTFQVEPTTTFSEIFQNSIPFTEYMELKLTKEGIQDEIIKKQERIAELQGEIETLNQEIAELQARL